MKFGTSVYAKVRTNGLKGKTVIIKIFEDDLGTNQRVYMESHTLPGDVSLIPIKLSQKMRADGDNLTEGNEQEYFLQIEYAGQSVTSSLVNVNDDAPRIKIETKPSTVGVKKQEKKKEDTCVCKQYDLIWGGHSNVSCKFRKKVVDISKRQNFDPNHLMAVMYVESAHTFSTSKIELKVVGHRKNGKAIYDYVPLTKDEVLKLSENFAGAVGIIQFTPEAITGLNNKYGLSLTKRKLALMSQLDQLDYVEKYIAMWKETNQITSKLTLADLYLVVFAPSKMNGSDDNTIVYSKDSKYYNSNSSIDKDNNGISKKELAARAYDSFSLGLTNKESNFECENVKEETTTVKSSADSGFYIYKNGTIKYIKAQDSINYYIQEKEDSNNFIKLYTLTKNSFGLVKFPDFGNGFGRYGGVDTGGISAIENVGKGDHYLLPQTAAALFGIISEVKDKNWEVHFGDMSSENGSDPTSSPKKATSHHAGHGHKGKQSGLNIDFRYLNKNGKSFQGTSSSNSFDDLKNKEFFRISFKFGFNKNYATGKNYPGVNPRVGGHYDHGHIGTLSINFETVEKLNVNIIK